jgi:hypothetical protein
VAWTKNLKKSNILKIQMTKDSPSTAKSSLHMPWNTAKHIVEHRIFRFSTQRSIKDLRRHCDADPIPRPAAVSAAKAAVASHKIHRKLKMASSNHTVEVKAPARKKSIASLQA